MRANAGSAPDLLRQRVTDAMDIESGAGGVTPALARSFPVKACNTDLVSALLVLMPVFKVVGQQMLHANSLQWGPLHNTSCARDWHACAIPLHAQAGCPDQGS